MTPTQDVCFPALQGSGLLGFLAAMGLFKTLASVPELADCQMKWIAAGGSYQPVIRIPSSINEQDIPERIHPALASLAGNYAITLYKDLKIESSSFRLLAERAANDFLHQRATTPAEMVASFGSDAVCNDGKMIEDTAFRTMSGAGHQHFLEFMKVLAKDTTLEQLREAIFGPWRYRDPSPIMRWDSEADRRYALRWDEPSKDPVRTVRGANLLAIAALTLFPTAPISSREIATTGFKGRGSRGTFLTWPIWSGWLTLDCVRSVISRAELQNDKSSSSDFANLGILALFRSQRITLGKFRNFTPAKAL